jgi:hypothetical protein
VGRGEGEREWWESKVNNGRRMGLLAFRRGILADGVGLLACGGPGAFRVEEHAPPALPIPRPITIRLPDGSFEDVTVEEAERRLGCKISDVPAVRRGLAERPVVVAMGGRSGMTVREVTEGEPGEGLIRVSLDDGRHFGPVQRVEGAARVGTGRRGAQREGGPGDEHRSRRGASVGR